MEMKEGNFEVEGVTNGVSRDVSGSSSPSLSDFDSYDQSDESIMSVGIEEFTPGGTKFWIPDVDIKPFVGSEFSSLDDAWEAYKTYAQRGGFEVKKGGGYDRASGDSIKKFLCTREGHKASRKLHPSKSERRKRSSCRIGCLAYLKLQCLSPNVVKVIDFSKRHNHSLVSKNDVQFLRAYRQLTYTQKQFIHNVSFSNMGPVHSFKLMKQMYGGFENVGATSVDCKKFRRIMNLFIGECDAQMVVEKLLSRKHFITGFFVDYFTDEDNALAGLLWADPEAKRNFDVFGDVVSFDTTF